MIRVQFAEPALWPEWDAPLRAAFAAAGLAVDLRTDHAPGSVDYLVWAPSSPVQDFRPYAAAKAVLSLWAGVERVADNATLTRPLVRMIDPALAEGMVEWVTGHVLRHHLGMDAHIIGQDGVWRAAVPPLARQRRVGVLGLGELGAACAGALAALRFDVRGWSRTPRRVPGIACHHGAGGLGAVLEAAEILVLLLPLTRETEALLDAAALARLPRGAAILNPGRGRLIDDAALLAALDAGQVGHATLDVFRVEPLPSTHPFWAHPRVTVTPHIASATRPETAARAIASNVRRGEAGLPFHGLVDRARGY